MNNEVLHIIDTFSLWNELKFVIRNNKSSFLPYHNLNHILSVMDVCYNLSLKVNNDNITDRSVRNLLVAALFHDFNHSGGKMNDIENIKVAIDNFNLYLTTNATDKYFDEDVSEIRKYIHATCYPYIKINDLSIYELIIRDADLVQSSKPDFFITTVGLSYEHNADINLVLENVIKFNRDNPFHLQITQELYGDQRKKNMEDIRNVLLHFNK